MRETLMLALAGFDVGITINVAIKAAYFLYTTL